jgi:hypothetical protein
LGFIPSLSPHLESHDLPVLPGHLPLSRHRPHHRRDSETMTCSGDSGCRQRQWCACA